MKLEEAIREYSKEYDSFYIYDERRIEENIGRLKEAMPDVLFLYSAKTNPFPEVIDKAVSMGLGIDAASLAEVRFGAERGLGRDMIYYSAPGKLPRDMERAAGMSIVVADSLHELEVLDQIGRKMGEKLAVGVRINPNFTMDDPEKGVGGKFGIDEDLFSENIRKIKGYKNIEIMGIHVHSRSQELDSSILARYYENMFRLMERVEKLLSRKMDFVNMGGGIGIPFAKEDPLLDTRDLGRRIRALTEEFSERLAGTKVIIETGRYVIGNAGTYVSKVVDKKVSHGVTYVVLNATMNGFIRPSISCMVEGYVDGVPKMNEPLYTKPNAFAFDTLNCGRETETVNLVGSLCTGQDVMAKGLTLPKLEIGDVVTVSNAGCYAYVLTPVQFASLTPPRQIFLKKEQI